jgi:16S rRNA (guanine(527)-N(7))-methyltransferase RsmG
MSESRALTAISDWLCVTWSRGQLEQLERYEAWLGEEAIVAGGIGPGEAPRLFDRHIADSLAFLRLIRGDAATLIDVGSGVGLPAIPIAIARPDTAVTVVDRSARRTHLAARATRVLGVENVTVVTADVGEIHDVFDVVTYRASLPIADAIDVFQRIAAPHGTGIFAWSRQEMPKSPPQPPDGTILSLTSEGVGILRSPAWFLRMERSP